MPKSERQSDLPKGREDHASIETKGLVEQELRTLAKGPALKFSDIIDSFDEDESYFLCSAGAIVRVLRGPVLGVPGEGRSYAVVTEFYNLQGNLLDQQQKHGHLSAAFALNYSREVRESRFYKLAHRPSFLPDPKTTYTDIPGVYLLPRFRLSISAVP